VSVDELMPAVFVGHGSPMNTLQTNRYTTAWSELAAQFPRPRAIVAISAHWYINATAVTAMPEPRTIHDFYGFPPELFAVDYPAPGDPELALEIAEIVKPMWVGQDADSWGIDHGTWSILAHMYPRAEVPVVQLSIDASKPAEHHLELGAALAPLRESGVLILASGNVVHNLGELDRSAVGSGFDWARDYNETANALMAESPAEVARLLEHPHHRRAAPTPDHLLPLFYVAGLAARAGAGTVTRADGYEMGALSMTSHLLAE
jgi:4,5-DOPA dioxygenase extradiol